MMASLDYTALVCSEKQNLELFDLHGALCRLPAAGTL